MNLREQLERFEGRSKTAYPDPISKGGDPWTIGVGHCGPEVHAGLVWTDEQIDKALSEDIDRATTGCQTFPWFNSLNEPRQAVLIGMVFQMGLRGVQQFVHMLGAVRDERWAVAAEEMRRSTWAKQTPRRANILAHQMETGEWQ